MKGKKVNFRDGNMNDRTGIIQDKVLVMPAGGSASYDSYVILDDSTEQLYVVNPLNLKSFEPSPKIAREGITRESTNEILLNHLNRYLNAKVLNEKISECINDKQFCKRFRIFSGALHVKKSTIMKALHSLESFEVKEITKPASGRAYLITRKN